MDIFDLGQIWATKEPVTRTSDGSAIGEGGIKYNCRDVLTIVIPARVHFFIYDRERSNIHAAICLFFVIIIECQRFIVMTQHGLWLRGVNNGSAFFGKIACCRICVSDIYLTAIIADGPFKKQTILEHIIRRTTGPCVITVNGGQFSTFIKHHLHIYHIAGIKIGQIKTR